MIRAWYFLLWLIDCLVCLIPTSYKKQGTAYVRLDNIGDFILWYPCAKVMVEHQAEKPITLIANQSLKSYVDHLGLFTEVIGVDPLRFRRNILYRLKTLVSIRLLGLEVVIDPTLTRHIWTSASLVRVSGATHKIGFISRSETGNTLPESLSDRWYSELKAVKGDFSEISSNTSMLQAMQLDSSHSFDTVLPRLESSIAGSLNDYIVICPGASAALRQWPSYKFVRLCSKLLSVKHYKIVICGSSGERNVAKTIVSSLKCNKEKIIDLTGRTSIKDLVEVVRGASLLVSNETSATHIASALGVPNVCILGGGHFGRFVPYPMDHQSQAPLAVYEKMECYGCDWQCVYEIGFSDVAPCIDKIGVDSVVAACLRQL